MSSASQLLSCLHAKANYGGMFFYDGQPIFQDQKHQVKLAPSSSTSMVPRLFLNRALLENNKNKLFIILQVTKQQSLEGKVGHWTVAGHVGARQVWFDPYGLTMDSGYQVLSKTRGSDNMAKLFNLTLGGTNPSALWTNTVDYQSLSPEDDLCGIISAAFIFNPRFFMKYQAEHTPVSGKLLKQSNNLIGINKVVQHLKNESNPDTRTCQTVNLPESSTLNRSLQGRKLPEEFLRLLKRSAS